MAKNLIEKAIDWGRRKSPWIIHFNAGACNGCDIEVVAVSYTHLSYGGIGDCWFCMHDARRYRQSRIHAIPQLDTRCCGTSPIAFHGDSSCGIRKNAWHLSIGSGLLDFL